MNLNRQFPRYFVSVFHVLSLNLTLHPFPCYRMLGRYTVSFVDVWLFTWKKIIQFSLLQALLELELNSTDLRSSLRELYISGAKVSFNNLS